MAKQKSKEESVTISKNLLFGVAVGVLVVLLILSVITGGFGLAQPNTTLSTGTTGSGGTTGSTGTAPSTGGSGSTDTTANLQTIAIDTGSLPALGQSTAPVKIIEFSDFQCPFCGRFYTQTESTLLRDYVNTGKVQFYYRDYPLPFHPNSDNTALAARCANDQGKFWEYHNLLFDRQTAWSNLGDDAITATLVGYAGELALDTAAFETCLSTREHEPEVGDDIAEGQAAAGGPLGTPSFFILIPKDKVTQEGLTNALSTSPYGQYVSMAQTNDAYVVFIQGALPTDAFRTVLDAVNY